MPHTKDFVRVNGTIVVYGTSPFQYNWTVY